MKDVSETQGRIYRHTKAAPLFTPLAYEQDENLFLLEDQHLGFGFHVSPLNGADDTTVASLNVLLTAEMPANTFIQFSLFGSPDIESKLNEISSVRAPFLRGMVDDSLTGTTPDTRNLLSTMVKERIKFLRDGLESPLEDRFNTRIRDNIGWVVYKIPYDGEEPKEQLVETIRELSKSVEGTLETIGFAPRTMDEESYVRLMNTILNWDEDARWKSTEDLYTADELIRDQLMDIGNAFVKRKDGRAFKLGKKHVRMLSVKRFPDETALPNTARYIGDPLTGNRGIRQNYFITANIFVPDQEARKATLERKRQMITRQAYGPLLKWVPRLKRQKDSHELLEEAFQKGDKAVDMSLHVAIFADDEDELSRSTSSTITFWREMGYQLLIDRYMGLPIFLNCLPFGIDPQAQKILGRTKTLATEHVVNLLPVIGEWQGTGTPAMQFVGRNGQLINIDMFDTSTNFNCVVAASSGAGKSFATNNIVTSYASMGARIWIIDVGRSYEKLCHFLGGDFIEFSPDKNICMNPFPIIRSYKEEEDMLVGLLRVMAAPNDGLSDFQISALKSELGEAWEQKGHELGIDFLADSLKKRQDNRVSDIGTMLYPFTSKGTYGRFFNGENNVDFRKQINVLELEELKSRKHLQITVLMQLIHQIQQATFLGDRSTKKLTIVDESWELLAESGEVAQFIVAAYRRFRKHGAAAVTVTQSINDMYNSKAGVAIVENSANLFLLKQKAETVDQLKEQKRMSLDPARYDWLKSVHTARGKYSEIFFYTERGAGIGRLIEPRYNQLLYSTHAEEVAKIAQLERQGMTTSEAILHLIEQENGSLLRDAG